MGTPLTAIGCPSCGTALGQYELLCPTCGAKLKTPPVAENISPRARELHGIASAAIAQAIAQLRSARKQGVEVAVPETLLSGAQDAAESGKFAVALELASKCGEEVENLSIQYEALQSRLAKARRLLAEAREDGVDVTEAEEYLELAESARDLGDYKSALRFAIKCTRSADAGKSGHTAWKVEISDWLK